MSYSDVLKELRGQSTLATTLVPLPDQIENNAGGYYYAIDDWARLDRFLMLGTESGTYYVNAPKLTKENSAIVLKLLDEDPNRVMGRVVELSTEGRLPKNDTALFVLALAASHNNLDVRRRALYLLPKIARTGTHLLTFVDIVTNMRGWGSSLKKGIAEWFTSVSSVGGDKLAYQMVKYNQRGGWAMRDLLRLSHPKVSDLGHLSILFDWITHPKKDEAILRACQLYSIIRGKYEAQEAVELGKLSELPCIIKQYNLPREALPTEALNDKGVWEALLDQMPITAMIRNLGKMSAIELLAPWEMLGERRISAQKNSSVVDFVVEKLTNQEILKDGRVHPMQLLLALRTYAQGKGELGKLSWTPVPAIIEALDKAYDLSFNNVEPTNKRILVAMDLSGSMDQKCAGSPVLSSLEAAAAMAVLLVRTEPQIVTIGFDTNVYETGITKSQRLDDVIMRCRQVAGGGTDLAAPIAYALARNFFLDAIVIITDNETWAGKEHAQQALARYRATINPMAKIIVISSAANGGSIINPKDELAMGIAGFDPNIPQLISDFIKS